MIARTRCLFTLALTLSVASRGDAFAQGVTTAVLRGTVRLADGGDAAGARISITNTSTGYVVELEAREGRFFASGLETGGPYVVEVRRLGTLPTRREGVMLTLGEHVELAITLDPVAKTLDTMLVTSTGHPSIRGSAGGTTIGEGVLRDMPALNRDVLDFARLVPALGTRFGSISGAGVGFRFNSYLIDGASERLLNGNAMLSGTTSGKPISIDAVKEYQVLLAPYDPRYGDFAGALVNAVTKSGTNEMHGSAFVYARNEDLARQTPFLRNAPYDRSQLGFSVGGPILRDRAHFFVAAEFQRLQQPAVGPFVGQSPTAADELPASLSDIQRFESILRGYGLEPGSGERVTRENPSSNVFVRTDFSLPRHSRIVLRHNYADTWSTFFSRPAGTSRFPLSSNAFTTRPRRWSTVLQLFTQLQGGWTNELLMSRAHSPAVTTTFARSPLVEVSVPGANGFSAATLVAGSPDNGQGTGSKQRQFEMADHLTYQTGAHTLTAGARAEWFSFSNISTRGQFGRWNFTSLDALEQGMASRFRVEKDFGSATASTRGVQTSAYLGDSWRASSRLTITGGMRAEVLTFTSKPSYNPAVDSLFGRRTDEFPGTRLQWSPRLGFVLDVAPARAARLRGGAGIFAGRPPLAWLSQALRFDGVGTRSLDCQGTGEVPPFVADPANMPPACANGEGFADGLVNLIDARLRMAEMFRTSLAYERTLPFGIGASIEGFYTRTLSDLVFVNANLAAPQGTDAHGRILYGSLNAVGVATPTVISPRFFEMIDIRNHGNGHSLALTGRAQRRFADRLEATASYTRSRVRDVQSVVTAAPPLTYAFWANSRPLAGRHEQLTTGISAYEIPHRVVVTAGWQSRARRWPTTISFYYVGESGVPFTFTDSTPGRGDLNADGTNSNDPIYVPRNALDPAEIAFDGPADTVLLQRQAFESFVGRTPCLRSQRGRILPRNSCLGPWMHTANASLRQALPAWNDNHAVSLDVEIFNVLNLLNARWGLMRVPNTVALQHVRQDVTVTPSQPVFRFDANRAPHSTDNLESAYQIQFALRYRF
ncbi:MAG: carboxypeptidase regulatory-like domain-containing protein [Gemmatimonadaceae bacterium]